jgi:hypothetical protein
VEELKDNSGFEIMKAEKIKKAKIPREDDLRVLTDEVGFCRYKILR